MTNDYIKEILIVCTGNVCRSPMTAGLIYKRIALAGLSDLVAVRSAGISAREGMQTSRYTVELLKEHGVEIKQNATHRLSPRDLEEATLIIVMEEHHRRSIFHMAPEHIHKVVLISELANRHEDVHDPVGRSKTIFKAIMRQIDILVELGWPNLLKRLSLEAEVGQTH